MKKFIFILIILFITYFSKPLWEDTAQEIIPSTIKDPVINVINTSKNYINNNFSLDKLNKELNLIFSTSENSSLNSNDTKENQAKLNPPKNELFSINNIELNDSKKEVEDTYGEPKRSSLNEYNRTWNTYHEDYKGFIMVSYDENKKVSGLFTNQDLVNSSTKVKLGSSKEMVREEIGTPESIMRKGGVNYELDNNETYDLFQTDQSYITVFYDKHNNNTVTAIQIINKNMEKKKEKLFADPSDELNEGFKYQLFDLTNATRVKHELPVLDWDEKISKTAEKHSLDMAKNQYFSHTNLNGKNISGRMEEDNIDFITAGENLAFGQFSSIFAHQGLMNSLGHRKNIMNKNYHKLGIGIAFDKNSQPYFTENFYSDSSSP